MADSKISELTSGVPTDTDIIPFVDLATGTTKKAVKTDLIGSQGYQGPQGCQGPQGFQGVQGCQGSQGFQGPQGLQGYQGIIGTQGTQGFQGNQGSQGPQGPQGSPNGPQGTQGFQGPQGTQGFQGIIGTQGTQGFQGTQGSQGTQGFQGIRGTQGTQGFQGPQGNQGSQGYQGPQGYSIYPGTFLNTFWNMNIPGYDEAFAVPGLSANASETTYRYYVPYAGTLKNMYVYCNTVGASGPKGVLLMANEVSAAISATCLANTTLYSDVAHTYAVSAGTYLRTRIYNYGDTQELMRASVVFEIGF